jgi:DNA-directed RNA polymerase specialized sigma54-like protein
MIASCMSPTKKVEKGTDEICEIADLAVEISELQEDIDDLDDEDEDDRKDIAKKKIKISKLLIKALDKAEGISDDFLKLIKAHYEDEDEWEEVMEALDEFDPESDCDIEEANMNAIGVALADYIPAIDF